MHVDRDSLLEMVFRLFNLMLLYSFKEELDGWRLWAEIAAAFHAYVRAHVRQCQCMGWDSICDHIDSTCVGVFSDCISDREFSGAG